MPFRHSNASMNKEFGEPDEKRIMLHSSENHGSKTCNEKEYNMADDEESCSNFEKMANTNIVNSLYDKIVMQEIIIRLPRAEWGLHCCCNSGLLIFSVVELMPDPYENTRLIPIYTKQVFQNNNNIKYSCFLSSLSDERRFTDFNKENTT